MNILVLGPYAVETSGPSRVLTEIVTRLSSEFNIVVVSPKRRRDVSRKDFQRRNISVVYQECGQIPGIPGSNQWVEIVRVAKKLNSLRFSPDIVWIHSNALFMAFALSKFRNVRSLLAVHGVFGQYYMHEMVERYGRLFATLIFLQAQLLQKFAFKRASQIATYSSYLRKLVLDVNTMAEVTVIPNGVDCNRFKPSSTNRKNIVLYVGRMARIKGVHVLIKSFNRVVQKHPNWKLRLVGGAFDQPREYFEKCIDTHARANIEFVGFVPNEQIPLHMNSSRIFVMPTLRDGFEIALMEAISNGIPCITTDAYERSKLYAGYAELVPPNDEDALAKRICHVIENYSEYSSINESNKRINYARQFDWSSIAEKYGSLFKEIQRQ